MRNVLAAALTAGLGALFLAPSARARDRVCFTPRTAEAELLERVLDIKAHIRGQEWSLGSLEEVAPDYSQIQQDIADSREKLKDYEKIVESRLPGALAAIKADEARTHGYTDIGDFKDFLGDGALALRSCDYGR